VYLRFHHDMTERQIAQEVGISQAHVSRLLAAALTKLRAELADEKTPVTTGDTTEQPVVSPAEQAENEPETGSAKATTPGKPDAKPAAAYSGRFLVRMSSELHHQLAQAAEREQVSLNKFVTDSLAASVSGASSDEPATAPTPAPDAGQPSPPGGSEPGAASPPRSPTAQRSLRLVLAANLVVVLLAGTVAVVLLVLALRHGL
jgi:hypothetical protein